MTSAPPQPRLRAVYLIPLAAFPALVWLPIEFRTDPHFWRTLGDAFHLPLLGLFAYLLFQAFPSGTLVTRLLRTGLIATAAAWIFEAVQPWVARSATFTDFVNGVLGILCTVSGLWIWRRVRVPSLRLLHGLVCAAVLLVVLMPAYREWRGMHWRTRNFPLLGDFEIELEQRVWRPLRATHRLTEIADAETRATHGARGLEILTDPGAWSGVSFHAGRSDWSAYDELRFDLLNLNGPMRLHIRIDDANENNDYHSRFNRATDLEPGWNSIRIPLEEVRQGPVDRLLDLSRIDRLVIFADRAEEPRTFVLDHARLVPGKSTD